MRQTTARKRFANDEKHVYNALVSSASGSKGVCSLPLLILLSKGGEAQLGLGKSLVGVCQCEKK